MTYCGGWKSHRSFHLVRNQALGEKRVVNNLYNEYTTKELQLSIKFQNQANFSEDG